MGEVSRKPSSDIPASELWAKIASSERPYRVVDFPRKDPISGEPIGKLAIRILTQSEVMICSSVADKFTKDLLKEKPRDGEMSRGYEDIYRNESAVQVLVRACRDHKDLSVALFPNAAEMRNALTSDEIGILMRSYVQVQSDLGPIVAYMTDEEREAWITRLTEGGEVYPLAYLSSDEHDRLTLHLASQLRSLLTDKSSVGSQPEKQSSESIQAPDAEPLPDDEFKDR